MRRRLKNNLNTPEYWDEVYLKNRYSFDVLRMEATIKGVEDGFYICDIGAGTKGAAAYLANKDFRNIKIFALDHSIVAVNELNNTKKILAFRGDVLNTPFFNSFFDFVICSETIEHLEHPELLPKELTRITKHNGAVVISTVDNTCEDSKRNNLTYPEHVFEFNEKSLIEMFSPYGRVKYDRVGNYDFIYLKVDKTLKK